MMNARDEVIRRSRLSPGRPEYDRFIKALDAYRAQVLREAADNIDAQFKDPNPLASVFAPYVGDRITDALRKMADRS